jgi:hypothetical protein
MADKLWYAALNGKQAGPFAEPLLRAMIARGEVRPDTLVWSAPMANWTRAADVPGLIPAHRPPPLPGAAPAAPPTSVPSSGPPAAPYPPQRAGDYPGGEPGVPFTFTGGPWALLGRTLLVALCQYLVIPSPWANTAFYRWFVAHSEPPSGPAVTFTGMPGDIWYIFILNALCAYAGAVHPALPLITIPLSILFNLIIIRWFFANLAWEGQSARLVFTGGYWALLGWFLFTALAFLSIIGWAWVMTATLRWLCRHVEGSGKKLSFVGGGWSLLWRTWVFTLTCILIIPIPWMLRWYVRWMVSQFHLSERV